MRRSIATISAAVLGLALITPGTAHAAPSKDGGLTPAERTSLNAGIGVVAKAPYGTKPQGPNPLLADVPDRSKVDYSGWSNYMKAQAKSKAAARLKANALVSWLCTSGKGSAITRRCARRCSQRWVTLLLRVIFTGKAFVLLRCRTLPRKRANIKATARCCANASKPAWKLC